MKKIILLVLMLIVSASAVFGIGIGIAPSTIYYKDALIKETYYKEVSVQSDYCGDVSIELANYTEYFDYPSILKFEQCNGQIEKQKFNLTFYTPKVTPTIYETNLRVMSSSAMRLDTRVQVRVGAIATVRVDVTTERITDIRTPWILTRDVCPGQKLWVDVYAENYGNIEGEIKVVNTLYRSGARYRKFTKKHNIDIGYSGWFRSRFNRDLPVGTYSVKTDVYYKEDGRWKPSNTKTQLFQVVDQMYSWC